MTPKTRDLLECRGDARVDAGTTRYVLVRVVRVVSDHGDHGDVEEGACRLSHEEPEERQDGDDIAIPYARLGCSNTNIHFIFFRYGYEYLQ